MPERESLHYLDAQKVLDLIREAKDHFFRVTFVKRTDGTVRTMTCRRHVAKSVLGVLPPEVRRSEDVQHEVLTVWDVQNAGFRRIPLDSVLEVRVEGQTIGPHPNV